MEKELTRERKDLFDKAANLVLILHFIEVEMHTQREV